MDPNIKWSQGLNPQLRWLLNWQVNSLPRSHQANPVSTQGGEQMHRVLCGQRDSLLEREVDLAVLRDEAKPARKEGGIALRRTRINKSPSSEPF